jgi:hypothetical protein
MPGNIASEKTATECERGYYTPIQYTSVLKDKNLEPQCPRQMTDISGKDALPQQTTGTRHAPACKGRPD